MIFSVSVQLVARRLNTIFDWRPKTSNSPSWGEGEDSKGLDEFVRNKLGQDERELKFRRPRVAFIYGYSVNYDRLSNYGPLSTPCNACLTRSIAPVYSHSTLIQAVYIICISV